MDKWAEGDAAARELEEELARRADARGTFSEKIERMTGALQAAMGPWNMKGDDRVLSLMRIAAGAVTEELALDEIARLKRTGGDEAAKGLEALAREIGKISWLADGFKSSIKVAISFATADLRMAGWSKE
jgi:hypothetical protein